jgi:hypothetical protein
MRIRAGFMPVTSVLNYADILDYCLRHGEESKFN